MSNHDLKPCPFCGGEAEIWRASADPKRPAWVGCVGRCAVLVSREYETTEEAIAAWNRRTPPAAVPDGWQPIETAPKDGTRFWGKVGDDAIAMLWHDKFNAFVSSWRCMQMAPRYQMTEHHHSPTIEYPTHWSSWCCMQMAPRYQMTEHHHSPTIEYPTHWMPLPAAPTETSDE